MKKTITFRQPSQQPTYLSGIVWLFPLELVDSSLVGAPEEASRTTPHFVKVVATAQLIASWGYVLAIPPNEKEDSATNVMKILFEYGKRHIIQKLKTQGNLDHEETIKLNTTNTPVPCEFDPSRIQDPNGAKFEVDIDETTTQLTMHTHNLANAPFVDSSRIEQLRAIKSERFDLTRLIRLCEELNLCAANDCYLAVAMLTRALVDHVPPIFSYNTFTEVANNYGGAQSFKDQMQHLDNSSRKIADAHLHIRIRSKEDLPSPTQVNFANDIDVLLGEIVRILK